jgi:hypothetical protein
MTPDLLLQDARLEIVILTEYPMDWTTARTFPTRGRETSTATAWETRAINATMTPDLLLQDALLILGGRRRLRTGRLRTARWR